MFPTFKQRLDSLAHRLSVLTPYIIADTAPLAPFELRLGDSTAWTPLAHNSYWGAWQTRFEMRGVYTIPKRFKSRDDLALLLPLGNSGDFEHPEALLRIDNEAVSGVDRNHQRITLATAHKKRGQKYGLHLSGWTGLGGSLGGDQRQRLYMGVPSIVVVDRAMEVFITLARTTLEAIRVLDDQRPEKYTLSEALDDTLRVLDMTPPMRGDGLRASVQSAWRLLQDRLAAAGVPHPLTLHGVGHAHIDTAWLWTLAVTRDKVERTFHTVLKLMDEYPEYVFAASQPQHYAWFRERHPESFAALVKRVKAKRWEPMGGMWIEPDANVTGAESLVRQFMLGRQYFKEQFGEDAETPVLWLPDTFGFPASLPQIAAQAGMKYFFTIKLRWNEVNSFPHDSFWWQGIDGTRLLAHMSTVPYGGTSSDWATYNADPRPSAAYYAWIAQKDKRQHDVLMAYGWGDGGGGPTREMLESMRALKQFPGIPAHQPTRVHDFYRLLADKHGETLPTWDGELYLETHQGTLTSQARIKRMNHSAEKQLHDIEFIASYARLHVPGYVYPHPALRTAWEVVCLHQFHDILPGSSIDAVYDDAERAFTTLFAQLDAVQKAAIDAISGHFGGALVINTIDSLRHVFSSQTDTPLTMASPFSVERPGQQPLSVNREQRVVVEPFVLENNMLRAEFDFSGNLNRLFDKFIARDYVPVSGGCGLIAAYEDRPALFDAWNIDAALLRSPIACLEGDDAPQVILSNGIRGTIEFRRRILNSTVTIRVSLEANSDQLEYETVIDWREKEVLLRAEFPLLIHAREATYGIQWGQITRPTHQNTTWDAAQWEVAHHGWIDVSDAGGGVTVLDDGIYGGSVRQGRTDDGQITNTVALTLIKRASGAAPNGDAGVRTLRYALATVSAGGTSALAVQQFTCPVIMASSSDASTQRELPPSFVQHLLAPAGAIVETIKRAEDDSCFIVRLYEPHGGASSTLLRFGFDVASVHKADILENAIEPLTVDDDKRIVTLALRPFEIVTLRVVPA